MAYFADEIVDEIETRVAVYYMDYERVRKWNANRPSGTLRLLTGWCWIEKGPGRRVRSGFKTRSVALRDAFYSVLQGLEVAPGVDTEVPPGARLRRLGVG